MGSYAGILSAHRGLTNNFNLLICTGIYEELFSSCTPPPEPLILQNKSSSPSSSAEVRHVPGVDDKSDDDVSCSATEQRGEGNQWEKKRFSTLNSAVLGSQLHTHHCQG